jgi:hypothetical protein
MTSRTAPRLRGAIWATALATIAYVLLWIVTTQVADVRASVPFGDDPYDLFASVAIVLLPLVGGLTAIRVVRYGPSRIPAGPVAVRIVRGLAICLVLVSAAVVADILALVAQPIEAGDGIGPLVLVGVAATTVVTAVAWVALGRAATSMDAATAGTMVTEPDALDDLVAILPLPATVTAKVMTFGDRLRQHRIAAGASAALVAGVLAVVWHAVREGDWASPAAALIYGGILVGILLVAYLALIGPLRVLRAA